jgi:flavin-binding protein dodecin
MPEKTFRIIELSGVSDNSYAEATKNAVAKASETLRNLDCSRWSAKGALQERHGRRVQGRAEGRLPGSIPGRP